jgi:hypothetical protein
MAAVYGDAEMWAQLVLWLPLEVCTGMELVDMAIVGDAICNKA